MLRLMTSASSNPNKKDSPNRVIHKGLERIQIRVLIPRARFSSLKFYSSIDPTNTTRIYQTENIPKSTKQNDDMKIEHTTYDQTHGGRSTRRPSASQKMTASTSRPRRHSEKKSLPADEERPVTMWPRTEASPPEPQSQMTVLMLERRLEKETRKERTTPASCCSEVRHSRGKSEGRKAETQSIPPLRRKPNFSESLRECLGSPKSGAKKHAEEQDKMTKAYTLRDAIRAGKLEKVVPPLQTPGTEGRLAPPPPRPQEPASARTPRNKKNSSASNKVAEFIDRGADILDETRKELAGKVIPPFEHLNYSSVSCYGPKKFRRSSDTSDLSFCCVGENEPTKEAQAPTKKVQALKIRHQQNSRIRLSGEGISPWSQTPPAECRLCRKLGVRGIRGLCNNCEKDFMRPKTQKFEFHSSSDEGGDEIKPTPPLKDFKVLTAKKTREVEAKCKPISHPSPDKRERQNSQGSVKTEPKMTSIDSYPQIIGPPIRQNSQEAMTGGEDDDERFRSWQTPAVRDECGRTKSLFKRWSDCYETDDFESFDKKNDSVALVDREGPRPGTARSRDSDFYGFYDDLLREHGDKTPFGRLN